MTDKSYYISVKEIRKLHKLSYRAQQDNHLEVCGVLAVGDDSRVELRYLENISDKPCHYEVDIKDIRRVREKIKSEGKKILGSFHSHPISEAIPGPGDIKNGFYKGIELIYDVCYRDAKLWTIRRKASRKTAVELSLIIEQG